MSPEETLESVADRLDAVYRFPVDGTEDPIGTLVGTILSQNTNDVNRDRAHASLLERFGGYGAVASACEEDVAAAIRTAGLHRQKARTILEALGRVIRERGRLDLGFLGELPTEEGLLWLTASRGVGKKTAGIVLLFCFDKPYFPVDTHIRRVCARLGLIDSRGDPHDRLNAWVRPDARRLRRLHLGLIRLGREICHPRRPKCEVCPLAGICETALCGLRKEAAGGE